MRIPGCDAGRLTVGLRPPRGRALFAGLGCVERGHREGDGTVNDELEV